MIPIYARITVTGSPREEISLGKKVLPEHWDGKNKRVTSGGKEVKVTNSVIEQAKVDLERHFLVLQAQHEKVTSLMLKNVYLGRPALYKKGEEKKREIAVKKTFLHAADYVIDKLKQKVAKGQMSEGTLKRWQCFRRKVGAFLIHEYGEEDIGLDAVRFAFAEDFLDYLTLTDSNDIGMNAAMKYLKLAKQTLKKAVERGWLTVNPIQEFKCTYDQPERERLTMSEILLIYQKPLIPRLAEVRDVYVFCCFTGFAYSDVYSLEPLDLVVGIDGRKWVHKERQKTDNPETVPLLPVAEEILSKYSDHPYCKVHNRLLPVNSNQRYNSYLKEIAAICGINKELTTHIARHTFATTVTLENDVPLETVSKLLGHKSIRTTQIYARITQRKISNNMEALRKSLFTASGHLDKSKFEATG